MSCCGKNNGNYYAHPYNAGNCCANEKCGTQDLCCDKSNGNYDGCCEDRCNDDCYERDLTGISCPNHNNNDCCCYKSLREAACRLTNQRVVIYTAGCKMCVIIVSVGQCFIKAVNPCTQRIIYFNLNRIDNIEDVLPRCN